MSYEREIWSICHLSKNSRSLLVKSLNSWAYLLYWQSQGVFCKWFTQYLSDKGIYIRDHVLIPDNKLEWPNEKAGIFSKLHGPLCSLSHVLNAFRVKIILTASYLINRLTFKSLQSHTPWIALRHLPSCLSSNPPQPKVFGCTMFTIIVQTE